MMSINRNLLYDNGILLPADITSEQVADAILTMVELDEEKRKYMGRASRYVWENKFDATRNAHIFAEELAVLGDHKAKRIIIITEGFPYDNETSFMMEEVCELIKYFDVTIIAIISKERIQKNNINKIRICDLIEQSRNEQVEKHTLRVITTNEFQKPSYYLPYMVRYLFDNRVRTEKKSIKNGNKVIKLNSAKYYAKAMAFFKWLEKTIGFRGEMTEDLFYTYWHSCATLGLCLGFKENKFPRIITRTHGYDLYDERDLINHRLPFRPEMNDRLNAIFFVCKYGRDYFLRRNKYNLDENKYRISYLGSKRPNTIGKKELSNGDNSVFRLVSCSSLISIKRVDLIPQALRIIAEKNDKENKNLIIEWVHFGDGDLQDDIKEIAKNDLGNYSCIRYFFMGCVDNEYIHKYYAEKKVDCFITTSSSEGLPVSVMEAMSYGIPIIVTDVGGDIETLIRK